MPLIACTSIARSGGSGSSGRVQSCPRRTETTDFISKAIQLGVEGGRLSPAVSQLVLESVTWLILSINTSLSLFESFVHVGCVSS